jgi:hypothetical protein
VVHEIYLSLKYKNSYYIMGEQFKDTTGVIKIVYRRTENTMTKVKSTKGKTMIYKTYT